MGRINQGQTQSDQVDHQETTNRTHDGDTITPETLEATDSLTVGSTTTTDLANLGGSVKYNQATAPNSPSAGETWYDTGSGIYRVYADLGSGLDWHSVPPVQVLEEASTFAESDVTVTHNGTEVKSGHIQFSTNEIISDFEDGNTTTKSTNWDGWNVVKGDITAQQGIVINGSYTGELTAVSENANIDSNRPSETAAPLTISLQISSDTGDSNDTVGIVIGSPSGRIGRLSWADGGGDVSWFNGSSNTILPSWTAGTTYNCEFRFDFANDDVAIFINGTDEGTYSLERSASGYDRIELKNYSGYAGTTREVYVDEITEVQNPTSGDALVEWDTDAPAGIKSYDLVTYEKTLDGEAVTIDVEDGNENVLFSDIGENFDISTVDTSKNVKLRANLSRNDTANNPTVDYLARRFVR